MFVECAKDFLWVHKSVVLVGLKVLISLWLAIAARWSGASEITVAGVGYRASGNAGSAGTGNAKSGGMPRNRELPAGCRGVFRGTGQVRAMSCRASKPERSRTIQSRADEGLQVRKPAGVSDAGGDNGLDFRVMLHQVDQPLLVSSVQMLDIRPQEVH